MKKLIFAVVILILMISSQGCDKATNSVEKSVAETANLSNEHPDFQKIQKDSQNKDENIIDLRDLNGNIIYAQVFSLLAEPEKYEGKTIRVRGQYYGEPDPDGKAYYHFVFISDAAACCQQGLEFVRDGDYKVPQDYPSLEQNIEVSGIWGKYQDGENTFWRLNSAKMEILK
ncbi:MAG: hypothetical protein ACTTH0_04845 [Eubacteriales bacterium]